MLNNFINTFIKTTGVSDEEAQSLTISDIKEILSDLH